MEGVEEGTRTMMEVDSIAIEVAIENTQVAPHTTKVATKNVHPSTLFTIVETKKAIENLQHGDEIGIGPMVKQIVFGRNINRTI